MFNHILVLTDGNGHAVRTADYVVGPAATYGATLHVLYVVDVRIDHADAPVGDDDSQTCGETTIGVVVDRAVDHNVPVETKIQVGLPHEIVTDYGDERDIDFMVTGIHGMDGLGRYLLGSVAERVVRFPDAPALYVPPADDDK